MKYKIFLVLFVSAFIVLSMGITYSYFNTNASMSSVDQKIAGFIFNAEQVDHLELPLVNLVPGESYEYNFSVTNTSSDRISNVSIEYQLIIKTKHFSPLIIELYKGQDVILKCDETYSRDDNNDLICNSPVQSMTHSLETKDDYKLKVTFDSNYNSIEYANLIDFINIEIKSYQKV